MCFHSNQTKDAQTLENRFKAKFEKPELYVPASYNGFQHPYTAAITNNRPDVIQLFQWGLVPEWAKDKSFQKNTLNARLETIAEKPSFRNSVNKRCLIPADGFFEWEWLDPKGKTKKKYLIHMPGENLFAFAALWSEWKEPESGEILQTYTLLTTEANELMARIHNSKKRMPVILRPDKEQIWLEQGVLNMWNDNLMADLLD
jgi:putative SOS response-associated peptidase YedK